MTSVPDYTVNQAVTFSAACPDPTCSKVFTSEFYPVVKTDVETHWRAEHNKVDHPLTILARWIDDPLHGWRFILTNGTNVKYDRDSDRGGWPKVMKELVDAWREAGYVD